MTYASLLLHAENNLNDQWRSMKLVPSEPGGHVPPMRMTFWRSGTRRAARAGQGCVVSRPAPAFYDSV